VFTGKKNTILCGLFGPKQNQSTSVKSVKISVLIWDLRKFTQLSGDIILRVESLN